MEATEYESKATAFKERVEAAATEVFGEEETAVVVFGIQFGDMGKQPGLPVCIVGSNLPICLVGEAIHDMHDEVVSQHAAYHAEQDGASAYMVTDAADVSEEARAFAADLAEQLGVPVESIEFRTQVDTADLSEDDLPDWLKGSEVAEAMTGGDIAAAGLGLSDEDVAAIREEEQQVLDSQDPEQEV